MTRNPFEMSPDPYFFFPTSQHREALAGLVYGITARKGFLVLTGEVGTGKSLLVRCLLDQLDKRKVVYAYLFNSLLSSEQFLHYIAEDLGITTGPCAKNELLLRMSRYLIDNHRKGLTTVAIIDEAHHLDAAVLEEVRLLTNLETPQGKLLQIALVGQPELDEKLESHQLRQLKQRITLRLRLKGFSPAETFRYIQARLRLAGEESGKLFTPGAMTMIHYFSSGIPRLINTLCDNSLVAAYAMGRRQVSVEIIEEAAADLRMRPARKIPAASVLASSPAVFTHSARANSQAAPDVSEKHSSDEQTDTVAFCEAKHEPDF
ncbi:MAG TPA: AAA family ATPase [Candidatus Dormibacteraeota bacterium]|nr:AAA family ATPase [Candidatus Dormibacteraeota bacterium]